MLVTCKKKVMKSTHVLMKLSKSKIKEVGSFAVWRKVGWGAMEGNLSAAK